MKAKQFLMALLLCGCAALTSCEKTPVEEPTPTDGIDRSLAGSMLVGNYIMEAEITYDGRTWDIPGGDVIECMFYTKKVSDMVQEFAFYLVWDVGVCVVTVPAISLVGEPYKEALFYYTGADASVAFEEAKYTNVPAKVKGWIKKASTETPQEYTSWVNGNGLGPDYTCDIEGECTFNGKELKFHITSLDRTHRMPMDL